LATPYFSLTATPLKPLIELLAEIHPELGRKVYKKAHETVRKGSKRRLTKMPKEVPQLLYKDRAESFVKLLHENFKKAGVTVDPDTIGKVLEKTNSSLATCDQCTNGWRW
jgi:hypothetical protein